VNFEKKIQYKNSSDLFGLPSILFFSTLPSPSSSFFHSTFFTFSNPSPISFTNTREREQGIKRNPEKEKTYSYSSSFFFSTLFKGIKKK
jgi:hypothetical protein